ncbi:integrase catalytic domain-containing protein [Trichonephila clavata]|uniref:Integrase catalytic domain-containing protein n=1 Tax=Trichonephila clavata TaxID=2740835 RepID=A0A8X6FPQ7_TRICU|nr:integrase catalytic domain-containing protein [Trichonephila clavata]
MSIIAKLKKNELKLVAAEIGLTVPRDAKRVDLKRLIEESEMFKEDYELVKTVIEQVLKEVKTQESQQSGQIELERLKLKRVKAELELARFRTSANNSETSLNGGETEASIDVLIKSVRALAIKVPMQNNEILPIIDKCSSFLKLQRILTWCVRFKENTRNPLQITTGSLTVTELSTALFCLVRNVQSVYFLKEIWCIERGQQLPDSSNLLTFSPFLDERKILCVGGRLRHSNLSTEQNILC